MVKRVMLIEDDEQFREVVVDALTGYGDVEVTDIVDADAAATVASKLLPAVAVVDLFLGGRMGLDTARRLRAAGSSTRIVLTSVAVDHLPEPVLAPLQPAVYVPKEQLLEELSAILTTLR